MGQRRTERAWDKAAREEVKWASACNKVEQAEEVRECRCVRADRTEIARTKPGTRMG